MKTQWELRDGVSVAFVEWRNKSGNKRLTALRVRKNGRKWDADHTTACGGAWPPWEPIFEAGEAVAADTRRAARAAAEAWAAALLAECAAE